MGVLLCTRLILLDRSQNTTVATTILCSEHLQTPEHCSVSFLRVRPLACSSSNVKLRVQLRHDRIRIVRCANAKA